jgi:hypothetical protein
MRTILLLLFLLGIADSGYAQDKIVKKDGEFIEAKVIDFSGPYIKYKKFSDLEGPTYLIPKADSDEIIFENKERLELRNSSETTDHYVRPRNKVPDRPTTYSPVEPLKAFGTEPKKYYPDYNLLFAIGSSLPFGEYGEFLNKIDVYNGLAFDIEFGANLGNNFGIRAKYGAFAHVQQWNYNGQTESIAFGIGYIMVGPQYQVKISESSQLVFYGALGTTSLIAESKISNKTVTKIETSGNGYSIGISLKSNISKRVSFQPSISYLKCRFNDGDLTTDVLNITAGLGINFSK